MSTLDSESITTEALAEANESLMKKYVDMEASDEENVDIPSSAGALQDAGESEMEPPEGLVKQRVVEVSIL